MKVKSITIYKPAGEKAFFAEGEKLLDRENKPMDASIKEIRVGLFGSVQVKISDGRTFVFRGLPVSYIA